MHKDKRCQIQSPKTWPWHHLCTITFPKATAKRCGRVKWDKLALNQHTLSSLSSNDVNPFPYRLAQTLERKKLMSLTSQAQPFRHVNQSERLGQGSRLNLFSYVYFPCFWEARSLVNGNRGWLEHFKPFTHYLPTQPHQIYRGRATWKIDCNALETSTYTQSFVANASSPSADCWQYDWPDILPFRHSVRIQTCLDWWFTNFPSFVI